MAAWLHGSKNQINDIPLNMIVAETLMRKIPERASVVEGYVSDLVVWRFLTRQGRSSYRISAEAQTHFTSLFSHVETVIKGFADTLGENYPLNVIKLRPTGS